MRNTELLKPGTSYADLIANRYIQEPGFGDQPYPCTAHGLGMVICIESYVGEVSGVEGVKLGDQVLITESGPIALSRYPFEDELLSREI